MSEKLYEALEVCLSALEAGADLGSVLERFPDMKDDLRPLLETSRQARMLAVSEVPEMALRRGKAHVLRHAARMREASARPQKHRAIFGFPRLATLLGLALIFLFSGTGLVRASGGALPGDNLYPVKRTLEDVRLLLVFSPQSREELEGEFEQERLHEVDELLAEGRHETIAFKGVVTDQNGDLWVVSGVPVQITPESRLPGTPVTVGTAVMLQGRTNARGFVEAEYIELLGSNILLPTSVPTEIETNEDNSNHNNSGPEENDNGHQEQGESGSSTNEDQGNDENENNNEDEPEDSNSNSGKNENDHEEDRSENDSGGESESENSGSGGEHSENGNEDGD